MKFILISFILSLISCGSSITVEQKEKFEDCRSDLNGLKGAILKIEMDMKYGNGSFEDLLKMDIEDFTKKYFIHGKNLDLFLEKICEARGGSSTINISYGNPEIKSNYNVTQDTLLNKLNDE